MAFGGFTDYAPGPAPGSFMFNRAGGAPPVLLGGDTAAGLKAKLDASAGLAGQPVAGPGGGAPNDMGGSVMAGSGELNAPEPNMSAAPPQAPPPAMSAAPPPAPAPVENAVGPLASLAPAEGQGRPEAPPAAPLGPQPVAINGINTGYVRMPDGRVMKYTPPVAGLSQAQLEKKAATGVMTPHSASVSTQGGFEPSADYLENRANLAIDKELLVNKASDAEAVAAQRDQAFAAQQAHDADILKAQEQQRANEIEARYKRDEATKDKLLKEYGSARVDPTRVFSGKAGTARGILGVIASGLGQMGSGMFAVAGRPGQPNLAFQAFQGMQDRDIAAQENEIKVKGAMADNALAQFQRTGLSLDQAKAALRAAQLQWGASQIQSNAAQTKGANVDVNRDMMLNSIQGALNEANEDYRQKSLGTISKQVASQVIYPHAGSGGGYVAATPGEAMGLIKSGSDIGAQTATTAKSLAEAKKTLAQANATGQPHESAEIHSALDNLDNAASAAGLAVKEGAYGGEATGVYRTGGGIGSSDKSREFNNALRAVAPEVLKAQGERVTPQAVDSWMSRAQSMSGEQIKSFLQAQRNALVVRQNNELKYPSKGPAPAAAPEPAEGETE